MSPGGDHIWSKRFGDTEDQNASAVAVDASGNVIVTGAYCGNVDFGRGAHTSAGGYDIFLAKFGFDGGCLWSKSLGDQGSEEVSAVAVDASGSIVVTGRFSGTVDFGGGALSSVGTRNIFIAKFESNGTHLWSKRFGDGSFQDIETIAIDNIGSVILAGTFNGTIDFGGGVLACAGNMDVFAAKFDSDGTHLWSRRFGDAALQSSGVAAVDVHGNVIFAGVFAGTVDFDGGVLTSGNALDIFIAKFDANGMHLWSKGFGDFNMLSTPAIAVDASGNVIVTGYFDGTVDFGGGVLAGTGSSDGYIARLGADGAHLWSKRFGNGALLYVCAVAVDASEDVIVTGEFYGTSDFGGGALTSVGGSDIYVAKFGFDGAPLWSKRFGDGSDQTSCSVAADASRSVVIAGTFHGSVDFGGGALTSAGGLDVFVAKFDR